jgi:GxxExxY protein
MLKPNAASHAVIGAAIQVHNELGAGVLESAVDACMLHELLSRGLHVQHQVHLPVVYRDLVLPASYRVDFIVEHCLLVEIKCVERVLPVHKAQVLSYLRLTALKLGLLLNFNVPHLEHGIHRIINGPAEDL